MTALPTTFWAKVTKTATCWNWTAATNSRGYGCFAFNGRRWSTHRLAYESLVGPIPDGLTIDHLCRNKLCCNPLHLEPVTAEENVRRYQATVTDCPRGHPLTYRPGDRQRRCRPCEAERRREKTRLSRLSAPH